MNILRDNADELEFSYYPEQEAVFFDDQHKYRIIPKGRRTGYTHGLAHYCIEVMLDPSLLDYHFPGVKELKILWVDTIQTNINRYVDRYFQPILKNIKKDYWNWRKQEKELTLLNSYIDFRSSDRPENIEGFGYHLMVLNEAGIILKGEKGTYLWKNAILPMSMDFDSLFVVGGTPKGKTDKKTSDLCLYYELAKRGVSELPADKKYSTKILLPEMNTFIDQEMVSELHQELSGDIGEQEMKGKFVDIGSEGIFKNEWFYYCSFEELPERFDNIYSSWDTAFENGEENDYSACTIFGVTPTKIYVLYFWKGQVTFPDLKTKFNEVANGIGMPQRLRPWSAVIEKKASGHSLIQEISVSSTYPVIAWEPGSKDKVARANSITPYFKDKKVIFLTNETSHEVTNDLKNFPESGRDSTDTISQGLCYHRENSVTHVGSNDILTRKVSRSSNAGW